MWRSERYTVLWDMECLVMRSNEIRINDADDNDTILTVTSASVSRFLRSFYHSSSIELASKSQKCTCTDQEGTDLRPTIPNELPAYQSHSAISQGLSTHPERIQHPAAFTPKPCKLQSRHLASVAVTSGNVGIAFNQDPWHSLTGSLTSKQQLKNESRLAALCLHLIWTRWLRP